MGKSPMSDILSKVLSIIRGLVSKFSFHIGLLAINVSSAKDDSANVISRSTYDRNTPTYNASATKTNGCCSQHEISTTVRLGAYPTTDIVV